MAFEDMEHKSLKKLVSLCLLVSTATLGVVVYGTFYQNAAQKAALTELQGSFVSIVGGTRTIPVTPPNMVGQPPEVYRPDLGTQPPVVGNNPPEVYRPDLGTQPPAFFVLTPTGVSSCGEAKDVTVGDKAAWQILEEYLKQIGAWPPKQ